MKKTPALAGSSAAGRHAFHSLWGATVSFFDDGKLDVNKSQRAGIREKRITYTFLACGLTTSLTEETGTVRGEGVGGGERGAAVEAGAGGCEGDGGAAGAGAVAAACGAGVLFNGAGSVLLEGEQDTLSVFRSVELSKAGVS